MFERWENADPRTLVRLAIAAVVGLVVLGAIAGTVRQAGWNEGFLVGLLAGNGDSQVLAPYLALARRKQDGGSGMWAGVASRCGAPAGSRFA